MSHYGSAQTPSLAGRSTAAVAGTPSTTATTTTTPRRFSPYPTSLRTSLYTTTTPASVYAAASRVPLLAQLQAEQEKEERIHASASGRRQHFVATTRSAASPRVSLVQAQAITRHASTSTITTRDPAPTARRRPRTSNPFEALSAPAFDTFIDSLTSTLRSVLDPPSSSSSASAADARKEREKEREEKRREREKAREEREERRRVAAAEQEREKGETGEEQVDVFGEVKEVGPNGAAQHEQEQDGKNAATAIDDRSPVDEDQDDDETAQRRVNREDDDKVDASGPDRNAIGEATAEEEEEEDDSLPDPKQVFSNSVRNAAATSSTQPPTTNSTAPPPHGNSQSRPAPPPPSSDSHRLSRPRESVSPVDLDEEEEDVIVLDSSSEEDEDVEAGAEDDDEEEEDVSEEEGSEEEVMEEEGEEEEEEEEDQLLDFDPDSNSNPATNLYAPDPAFRTEPEPEPEPEIEMREVNHPLLEGRTPLFRQRGTASITTSEADGEELFRRFEEEDDEEDELVGRDARNEEVEEEEQTRGDYAAESTSVQIEYPALPPPVRAREDDDVPARGEEEDDLDLVVVQEESTTTTSSLPPEPAQIDDAHEAIPLEEDVYDVDAVGEGIQQEEEQDQLQAKVLTAPASQPDRGPPSIDMDKVVEDEDEDEGSIDADTAERERQLQLDDDDNDEEVDFEDPSVYKDPFGRPVRYEHGFGFAGEEDEYEYEQAREEDIGSGSEMDSAEAEWAGRRAGADEEEEEQQEEEEEERPEPKEVETLELLGDSDSDAEVGGDEPEQEEEEEASLTAQMLEDPDDAAQPLAGGVVEDPISLERRQEEEAELEVTPVEAMELSHAPTPVPRPEPTETPVELEVTPVAGTADLMDLASAATTPALQTPTAAGSYFGGDGAEEEEDKAVESGALADVDEDIVMSATEAEPTMTTAIGAPVLTPIQQVSLPLQQPVPIPTATAPEAVDVDEANLADVDEAAEPEEGEHARRQQAVSEPEALVVTEEVQLARFVHQEEAEDDDDMQATPFELESEAEITPVTANPLEALYEHEDSEDVGTRIPYEAKGKGRAPMTPSDLDFDGDEANVDVDELDASSEMSSDSAELGGTLTERLEMAISQWHSVSDQLRLYSKDELIDKLIELRAQYEEANETESPWEVLIRIQLYDVETEYSRRKEAGLDESSDSENESREEGEVRSQDGEYDDDHDDDEAESDLERHARSLDEEYEVGSDPERMRDDNDYDSGSPMPADRSAFPGSPPREEDDILPEERDAAEASLAAIADELVEMHEAKSEAELRIPSSALQTADSLFPPHTKSLYTLDGPVEDEKAEAAISVEPPSSAPARADNLTTAAELSFGPVMTAPLDPHRPFLRSLEEPTKVQHVGNIEYELAPPPRSSSPPRFERPPTEHRVDSPVTVDDEDEARQVRADEDMVRVGVEEEEMRNSTWVGRNQPLRGAVDASHEDVREQQDLDVAAGNSQGLVVIDDDGEEETGEAAETRIAPVASAAQPSPRKRIGATPPPSCAFDQDEPPIVEGVAPPVNYDILPDSPLRRRRASEEPAALAIERPYDHTAEATPVAALADVGQARSLFDSKPDSTLPSAELNRESATEAITSDSRPPYQAPPTFHRQDSPLEEGELPEDDDDNVVRVGITAEEEQDARLAEDARTLATAVDASRPAQKEQDDFAGADAATEQSLAVIDDDEDAFEGDASNSLLPADTSAAGPDPASAARSSSPTAQAAPAREELPTSFPYGVAPPQNPDILPTSPVDLPTSKEDAAGNVDFVALESDEDEDVADAEPVTARPLTASLQAEQNLEGATETSGRNVLGLPAEDAASATYETPVMAVDSDDEDAEVLPQGDDLQEVARATSLEAFASDEQTEKSSPLHISGVQEPGEWDPSSPIRFGRVQQVDQETSAEPGPAKGESEAGLAQVVIEVDTDGEGVQPTSIESVRGASVATDGSLGQDSHDPLRDVDVVSAPSVEPEDVHLPAEDPRKAESQTTDFAENSGTEPAADAPRPEEGVNTVNAVNFASEEQADEEGADEPSGLPQGEKEEGVFELARQYTPLSDDIEYTESDSDDGDEVVLALLSPHKAPHAGSSKAGKPDRRAHMEAVAQDELSGPMPVVRRSTRLSTTPAAAPTPPPQQPAAASSTSSAKRTRADRATPQVSAASPAKRSRPSKVVRSATGSKEVPPLGVRQHRHRHHLPEVHGSDTDDGVTPPVTRSHCHFERFKIASQSDPQAAPYRFNIPACALSSQVARDTIKAFHAEDLGPVDETDGCEGIQLGGVNPTDAAAIQVMASRHSGLVPHEDVLDAVRRIAGPELWDEGACEVVPQEEAKVAAEKGRRKGKRRVSEEASGESAKKRR
ncbi:hypothetical protein JCM10908_006945 [Rhodotorula pacifica]|uniref:uncharacterized protein n=1 Tax=Rhodotorula pacifica TaxID=1495444 RepID=UPI00317605B5